MKKPLTLSLFALGAGLLGATLLAGSSPADEPMPRPAAPPVAASEPAPATPAHTTPADSPREERPLVQLALLLDTSGSMSGLINQARSELWKVVNQLAEARRDGKPARLQIALFEYGNTRIPASEGYIRMVLPFTEELDRVSEELFSLTTNGGDEYCGQAIDVALQRLDWTKDEAAMKLIFIAGNEAFDQGPVDPKAAVAAAQRRGITVNTIYCGGNRDHDAAGWQQGAMLAEGRFMSIDHHSAVVQVQAPQDEMLARLGVELNETYIPVGVEGARGAERQQAQDSNSSGFGLGNMAQRSISKASGLYSNPSWELVDALKAKKLKLEDVKDGELPADLRGLSLEAKQAKVEAKAKRRAELQAEIQRLGAERTRWVAEEQKRQAGGAKSLDVALLETVRTQASKRGYRFE